MVDGRGIPVLVGGPVALTNEGWEAYARSERTRIDGLDTDRRRAAARSEDRFWADRHRVARREIHATFPPRLPADVFASDPHDPIDGLIRGKLAESGRGPNPPVDDAAFLRRLSLDTIGVPPTAEEVEAFLLDPMPDKRARMVDARLADPRWADGWMGYWQDVLAENPGILKPTLNNTGPFRRFLHRAMLDRMPVDRDGDRALPDGGEQARGAVPPGLAWRPRMTRRWRPRRTS